MLPEMMLPDWRRDGTPTVGLRMRTHHKQEEDIPKVFQDFIPGILRDNEFTNKIKKWYYRCPNDHFSHVKGTVLSILAKLQSEVFNTEWSWHNCPPIRHFVFGYVWVTIYIFKELKRCRFYTLDSKKSNTKLCMMNQTFRKKGDQSTNIQLSQIQHKKRGAHLADLKDSFVLTPHISTEYKSTCQDQFFKNNMQNWYIHQK